MASRPPASRKPDTLDALVTANAQMLGVAIDPSWRNSVKANLRLLFTHASLVDAFALPDDSEPAPVFRA